MTISVLGVLMIVATVAILAYFGFQSLSSFISDDASNSNANDELASIKSDYATLEAQYNDLEVQVEATNDKDLIAEFDNAKIELVKADQAITDVESAIAVGKSPDVVNERLEEAKSQLQTAKSSLVTIRSQVSG